MEHNVRNNTNSGNTERIFYEYQFPLINWFHRTDFLLGNIIDILKQYLQTFQQLHMWKQQGLLFQKPSCSYHDVFVFWVDKSLVAKVSKLQGVHGGYKVSLPDSAGYKNPVTKRHTPSREIRRVMLDGTVDHPLLIDLLRQMEIEVIRIWDLVADLVQYEIIEACTHHPIDLIVTADTKLFTSSEEWVNYLRSHRSQVCYVSTEYLQDLAKLSRFIYIRAHGKKEYAPENLDFYFGKTNHFPTYSSREEEDR